MLTTFQKAELLANYLKQNQRESDQVIDNVLNKLFDRERQALQRQSRELQNELADFEQRYGLPSVDFFEKFSSGKMGDALDFVDWAAAWQVYQTTRNALEILSVEHRVA